MHVWKQKFEIANSKGGIKKDTLKGKMYISTPKELAEEIKNIPLGKVKTTREITQELAKRYHTDYTCGLTTGIFIAIVANYSKEENLDIPYWRVVKEKGMLYEKYLGERSDQKEKLEKEGHKIVRDREGFKLLFSKSEK